MVRTWHTGKGRHIGCYCVDHGCQCQCQSKSRSQSRSVPACTGSVLGQNKTDKTTQTGQKGDTDNGWERRGRQIRRMVEKGPRPRRR